MTENASEFEILEYAAGLLDGLKPEQRRQVMAALAERYGLQMTEKTTTGRTSYRPTPRRKVKPW